MRVRVTEPGQKPYCCTISPGGIRFMLDNGWTVEATPEMSRAETEEFGRLLEQRKRDSAPSHEALYNGRLHHYEQR